MVEPKRNAGSSWPISMTGCLHALLCAGFKLMFMEPVSALVCMVSAAVNVVTLVINNLTLNMITYSFSEFWESTNLVPGFFRFLSNDQEDTNRLSVVRTTLQ